ncbi:sodium:solute symporter family protein [Pontibacter harenae]|uniref:sodium:solute symporter family protein n=1 Tax=Pontibacter harenae TaxID=2894083 RepID=UPI001E56DB5E|nr:sodium:solute symporter family protein [Pontibacter harenae]MCC9167722.1 sodium:solute symporter family protein [Pontibacter harenae]
MSWYLGYVVAYFIFMFSLGFYYFTKVKTSDDYLIGGWNSGFWSIAGTLVSTFCGAAIFIGWMGMGYQVGVSGYFQFALPIVVCTLLLVIFFAKPLRRQKLYTLADLFSERFGGATGVVPALLSAIVYAVPTLALQMVGMTTIWYTVFGLEELTGLYLSAALIVSFTILGGLPATIVTDALQSVVLIAGIIVMFVFVVNYAGGPETIIANTPREYLTPTGRQGLQHVLLFALAAGPFYFVFQSTWQRIFASKDEKTARNAGITAALAVGVITMFPFMIGTISRSGDMVPADINPDMIFSYLMVNLMPPVLGGIVVVGIMAALMTGATSYVLQGSSNFTVDLYIRLYNPDANDKNRMRASRITVVIMVILGLIVAFKVTNIAMMYQWSLRLSAIVLIFPFFAVMFWKRCTKAGVQTSMILSCIAGLTYPYLNIPIDHTVFGLLVSLVTLVTVSLTTKHAASEQVRAVYWDDLDSAIRLSAAEVKEAEEEAVLTEDKKRRA